MNRAANLMAGIAFAASSGAAAAQLRVPAIIQRVIPATRQQPQAPGTPSVAGNDFLASAGSDTVFFGLGSAILSPPARATLAAQAAWLRQHPEASVRIEGHGDTGDTRDHALAMGARRAEEVRSYLVLLGVPAIQVGTTSFGKERPGSPRAVTTFVR